jgi:phosphoribosylformylglycinamidine synthase
MSPKVLIIRTAGTNCDSETEFAFNLAGARTALLHINYVKEKNNLSDYQIICIPGGFSYGDDVGAGKIFSLELICWLKEELIKFIDRGGLILGICNGFQVLVKTGILPDLDFTQKVTLTFNDSQRFEARWVYLKLQVTGYKLQVNNIWFRGLAEVITLPVAHREGKFYTENNILDRIERNQQVALRYVDNKGKWERYPFNPNGSLNNIAGITDTTGKILGLMPHPERFIFPHHYPLWQEEEVTPWGLKIFQNATAYFK